MGPHDPFQTRPPTSSADRESDSPVQGLSPRLGLVLGLVFGWAAVVHGLGAATAVVLSGLCGYGLVLAARRFGRGQLHPRAALRALLGKEVSS